MKAIQGILIGARIFALTCGLTVLCSGCGDSNPTATSGTLSQEEKTRNEESRKAMEAASKANAKK